MSVIVFRYPGVQGYRVKPRSAMTRQHRVSCVLADDHWVVTHGLVNILRVYPDLDVVAVCHDGSAAARAIHTLAPSIAILEFEMRLMNGIEVLSSLGASKTKIIFLSAAPTDTQIAAGISGGARGIIQIGRASCRERGEISVGAGSVEETHREMTQL